MVTTKHQNELMQHTCGLINGEKRNFFGTSKGCSDSNEFEKLVKMGLATSHEAPSWSSDTALYTLTEAGKKVAKDAMQKPIKISSGKARYQRYLEYCDCFDTFIEFCRWDAEPEREWNN